MTIDERIYHCKHLEWNTTNNEDFICKLKKNRSCIKTDNCEDFTLTNKWVQTPHGLSKRKTYTCIKYDPEKNECTMGKKCSKKNVKNCFKNHPEFFKEGSEYNGF